MNKVMKKHLVILLLLFSGAAQAQERLTLQEAIAKTLTHNFDISIADLAAQQAKRNNTLGNAGFSPYILLDVSATQSRSNVRSDLANGSSQNNPNAKNTNYSPGVTVNWTIFDGGKMFLMKKELGKLEELGQLQLKVQMQTMVSRTIQVYAQLLWRRKQLATAGTAIALAKTRMEISDAKYKTGASAKTDYLQARVDYNARRTDSLGFVADLTNTSDSLSVLMGENEDNVYITDDSLDINARLEPVDKDLLKDLNLSLSTFRYNADISRLNEQIAKTYFLPSLSFNGRYGYSRTTNATGFSLFTQSYGPSGTISLTMPLFEGGNVRRQARVASLQAMKDNLLYEKQNTVLGRRYHTAWRNYELAVAVYNLAYENISYAKENLDVQQARFRYGVGTTLESRQAENDYVIALQTLYTAAYNLKVNETIVLEMGNQLVK